MLTMDQRRGPKPACPDKVRHLDDLLCGSYNIDVRHCAIFRTHCEVVTSAIRTYALHVLLFATAAVQRSTVLSHHVGRRRMMWLK